MGSLEAWRVAEGDRTSFWQAVIVDLFFGGSAWWDSSCPAASLQAGIDARGTRVDLQRRYGTSIDTIDRQGTWPLTLDGSPAGHVLPRAGIPPAIAGIACRQLSQDERNTRSRMT